MSGKGHCEKTSDPSGPGGTKGGPPWPDTPARARPKERRAAAACQPSAGAPPAGHRCCRSRRTLRAGGSVSRGPETTPSPGARAGRARAGAWGGGGEASQPLHLHLHVANAKVRGGSDLLKGSQQASGCGSPSRPASASEPSTSPPLLPRTPEPRGPLVPSLRGASPHSSPPPQSCPAPPAHLLPEPSRPAAPEVPLLRSPIASGGRRSKWLSVPGEALSACWHDLEDQR